MSFARYFLENATGDIVEGPIETYLDAAMRAVSAAPAREIVRVTYRDDGLPIVVMGGSFAERDDLDDDESRELCNQLFGLQP